MKLSKPLSVLILIASALLLSGVSASFADPLQSPKTEQHESLTEKQTPKAESNQRRASPSPSEIHPETSRLVGESAAQKKQYTADHSRPEASIAEWIMVGITSLYVIVAFFTLRAIKRQADIAEEAITEIERPWMMVLPTDYEIQPSAGTVQTPRSITFRWTVKNVGRSPAWLIGGRGRVEKVLASDLPAVPNYPEDLNYALTPHPPNEEGLSESATLQFSPTEYVALCEGKLDFVVRGIILYRGLGDRSHETRFCIGIQRATQRLAMCFCGPSAYNRYT
jgi:hypothetical protein